MSPRQKKRSPSQSKAETDDVKAYWRGELPAEKQDFCADWLRKRGLFAARVFFAFSIVLHVLVSILVELWLKPGDPLIGVFQRLHFLGLVYSAILVVAFDRGFRKEGIIYGATQIYLNAGSALMIAFEISSGRSEIHLLQAYMLSTVLSVVSLIASPFAKPGMTGLVFLQNVALMLTASFLDKSAGLSVVLWYSFTSGSAWILQTRMVVKSLREAMQEFESRKILSQLAKVHLDQELSLARHIEESFIPPENFDLGRYTVECYRQKNGQIGGHWFAVRTDGEDGLYALMCETNDLGVHGALILHAVQSLWAEDLGIPSFDPVNWLHKTNRALFVLGKTESHELEVTIVHVSESVLTYWGAGQRTLFLTRVEKDEIPVVRPLSREILKIGVTEHIFPAAMRAPIGPGDRIFIGNRGAFPAGDFSTSADLAKVHEDLRLRMSTDPARKPSETDRSLIVVSHRETVGQLLPLKHA